MKGANLKRLHTISFQLCNILKKGKTMERVKRIVVARGWGGGLNRSTEGFKDSETIRYDSIIVTFCRFTFVRTHRMYTKSES